MLSCEIEDDAGAESDREPRQEPAGANFGRGPFAKPRRNGELGARPCGAPNGPRPRDRPRPRAASRLALVRHRALPSKYSRATTNGRILHEARVCWRAEQSMRGGAAAQEPPPSSFRQVLYEASAAPRALFTRRVCKKPARRR